MKKYSVLCAVLACALAVTVSGCSQAVRYSADEIKDYPAAIQDHIKNGSIATGMTMQQVRYAWGAPGTVVTLTPTDDGKSREQWIYSSVGIFKSRLIFTDGKLTEIISSETSL